MTEKSEWTHELQDKETRDAFVSSQMSIPIAFQILALREQRGLTQKQLAEKAGMLQPRIAAMERPSGSEPNLRTLKRLASAFDVALIVRFAPFSELVEWAERFSPDTFVVPSFEDDPGFQERIAAADRAQSTTASIHVSRNVNGSEVRINSPQKHAKPRYENLTLDLWPAMPNQSEGHVQVKMTDTTRQGVIRYEGRVGTVGAKQRPAA